MMIQNENLSNKSDAILKKIEWAFRKHSCNAQNTYRSQIMNMNKNESNLEKKHDGVVHGNKSTPIVCDMVNRCNVQSEDTPLKFEVQTDLYDTEKLNKALLDQLKDKVACKPGELLDVTPPNSGEEEPIDSEPPSLSTRIGAPFGSIMGLNYELDDGEISNFHQRMETLKMSRRYPSFELGISIDSDFKVPDCIWNSLLEYQRTGVKWLQKLYKSEVGGVLSDEMGLGKTVQVISFLGSLYFTNKHLKIHFGPILIIAPATVLKLWLHEIFNWWPYFRVVIMHHTGSIQSYRNLGRRFGGGGTVVISTYSTILRYKECVLPVSWNYVVLDEGHKIKNPLSHINVLTLKIQTRHRIVVSGTPIQNNLKELWSLMNFVYPGLLGELDVFLKTVAVHITRGSYSNATSLQIKTGFTCAKMLKNMIKPYLLRRTKKQVQTETGLPKKSDFVLFCRLTQEQSKLYISTINSSDFLDIESGNYNKILKGITTLRKVCNHPNLVDKTSIFKWKSSSKLMVLHSLLHDWKVGNHKVLVYSQSVKMLNIIEEFCTFLNFTALRMDGKTPVAQREDLVQRFNSDPDIFIFLLTTKVGGVGINLTGADRVVIYDPDWNPTNDMQAKERAWRIGQTKSVIIYRILTSGTIEEKIYNRQVFKQFLANKVLEDPSNSRVKLNFGDIHELFSYSEKTTFKTDDIIVSADKSAVVPKQQKPKKRKYKWRKQEDISSDDEIMPTIIDQNTYVEKVRKINDSKTAITDIKLIELEAEKIAAAAIESLKSNKKADVSSEQSKLRNRPGLKILNALSSFTQLDNVHVEKPDKLANNQLAISLRDFFMLRSGRVTTRQIVSDFKDKISKGPGALAFKNILKTIAEFKEDKNNPDAKGFWQLKSEYFS